jgi:hypothetical protein
VEADLGLGLAESLVEGADEDAPLHEPGGGVDVLAPAAAEVVDDDDVVAAGEQRVDEVRADEAGPAGDEEHARLVS